VGVLATSVAPVSVTAGTVMVGGATSQGRQVPAGDSTGTASALVGSIDQAIAPRRFSGAATGMP